MPHYAKPDEGSWTEHYPQLGTGPVSYEDSISPEHYELEREAIFESTWLNVGRVEQLPRSGATSPRSSTRRARRSSSCVRPPTRSAPSTTCAATAATSSCGRTTRGEETSGTCRQFTCKYHGWRYSLEGDLTFVQQEGEFFDLDKSDYGLAPVRVETWEGFIFVNLDTSDTTPLRDYLGELGEGLEGYPFGEMTQVYKYRAEVGSNWKLFIDAFTEFYHAPVLHAKQAVSDESQKLQQYGYEALAYEIDGPHGMVSSWGGMSPPKDLEHGEADRARAAQRPLRSVGRARSRSTCRRRSTRRAAAAWGIDSFLFFPNFMVLVWSPNWYLTYHYWPTSLQHAHLRGHVLLRPAEERARASGAGARGGDVQGVLAPGRQHARSHAVDARVARGARSSRSATRRSCCVCCTRRRATTSPSTSGNRRRRSRSSPIRTLTAGGVIGPCLPCPPNSPTSSRTPTGASSSSVSATRSGSRARWTSCRRSTTPPSRASKPSWSTSTSSSSTRCPTTRRTCCGCATRW